MVIYRKKLVWSRGRHHRIWLPGFVPLPAMDHRKLASGEWVLCQQLLIVSWQSPYFHQFFWIYYARLLDPKWERQLRSIHDYQGNIFYSEECLESFLILEFLHKISLSCITYSLSRKFRFVADAARIQIYTVKNADRCRCI